VIVQVDADQLHQPGGQSQFLGDFLDCACFWTRRETAGCGGRS
jgi:hypothetical protein